MTDEPRAKPLAGQLEAVGGSQPAVNKESPPEGRLPQSEDRKETRRLSLTRRRAGSFRAGEAGETARALLGSAKLAARPGRPKYSMKESRALSIAVFAGYVVAALGVTNLFPLSTFPMYSKVSPTSGARLVVRNAQGELNEVTKYDAWSCEEELTYEMVQATLCPDGRVGKPAGYLSKEALDYIRRNGGDPSVGEPVDLIVRAVRLDEDPVLQLQCEVVRCRARRR